MTLYRTPGLRSSFAQGIHFRLPILTERPCFPAGWGGDPHSGRGPVKTSASMGRKSRLLDAPEPLY